MSKTLEAISSQPGEFAIKSKIQFISSSLLQFACLESLQQNNRQLRPANEGISGQESMQSSLRLS